MANWAKLQEQLTGLPVVKRDKHSIHFAKGDGEIVANFSSKPCHYEENGVWKPIDTGLLLAGDGFYGCPHSDVKIHKDGRVKAGGYQQKSTLVNAKEGVVDGDRIVREFEFGTQYLYMTEDGFRQETVITRPPTTQEAKFLIATETGELPSKYKRSDITAVDADGEVHEFVNLGQFKKWLDAAAYPVTIDPDFAGGTADCHIGCTNWPPNITSWTTARNTSQGYDATGNVMFVMAALSHTDKYRAMRGYVLFDTSSIGAGSTVTQSNLKMVITEGYIPGVPATFDVQIVKYDWSEFAADLTNATKRETAYDGCLAGTADDSIWKTITTATMTLNTVFASGNLSTDWVSKTGTTYYGLRHSDDFANNTPTAIEYIGLATSNHATESYRPVLSVTYTAGSTGVPKHFLHYARLRSN